jgi:outer membrane protein OmpA-like peptidoglycan-associated protein
MSPREARAVKTTVTLALAALIAPQGGPAGALTLAFPDAATETAATAEPLASYRLPTGPFDGQAVPARLAEGAVEARSWRIEGADQTTLALMRAIRGQVQAQGYKVVYECEASACGGFDFRFATEVLPEPAMHVDLGDFRFLAAEKGGDVASLIVSRSASAGFVQLTSVTRVAEGRTIRLAAADPAPPVRNPVIAAAPALKPADGRAVTLSTAGVGVEDPAGLIARLQAHGAASLDDLRFAAGATALENGDYASLAVLAGWLKAAPGRKVALVGHTDASGGLETNIVISRRRAEQVRAVLLGQYEVPRGQVTAEGVGYLAPRASNLTEAGQQANRRVEVVVTALE